MPLKLTPFPQMPEVVLIEPQVFPDGRGFFMETWKASELHSAGLATDIVQEGHSRNVGRGILRGLHYQDPPKAQGKYARCTVGELFDAIVDLRRKSPTYGRYVTTTLSAENKRSVWIPEGFAHGYVTLTEACEIQYAWTGHEFSAPHYRTLRWDDPDVAIPWPVNAPQLSPKDAAAPRLRELDDVF